MGQKVVPKKKKKNSSHVANSPPEPLAGVLGVGE